MKNQFLFLGSGGSTGVPLIGCNCAVCRSKDPHDKRLRPSGLLQVKGKNFLIDVGPDFREQALKYEISHIDGILITHSHFDHIGGLDDLRAFNFLQKQKIPCLLSIETFDELKLRYHYLIRDQKEGETVCADLDFHILDKDFGEIEFQGLVWDFVSFYQGEMKVTGFRLGDFAYISDIREFTEEVYDALVGVKTLVVSAAKPSEILIARGVAKRHLSIEEAIDFSERINASKTWITHIGHEIGHEEVIRELPQGISLAYDGLAIEF